MRILFAGGGTAGHVNPAIAVADFVQEREENSEFLFVGTKEGMESALVPKRGFEIEFIKIHGFERKLSAKNIKTVCEIFGGIHDAKRIIRRFRPDVVMGTGGYVTGPVLYAAAALGVPTLVHESNAYPGVTVRILSRYADIVALGMKEAAEYLPRKKRIEITGNPIRPSILRGNQFEAKRILGLDERRTVLIFGGSLGASALNDTAAEWIAEEAPRGRYQIIMSTGKNNQYDRVMSRLSDIEKYKNVRISEYIYDMDMALNAADLIIARSGSSVSEMTALGKPAILIPSPYVAGNHQLRNAEAVEASGGAAVIREDALNAKRLSETVETILGNSEKLTEMSKGSRSIGITDATERLYSLLKEISAKK